MITSGFEICTSLDFSNFTTENPRDQKIKLAYEIVRICQGEAVAKAAEESFINTFQKKEIPEEIEEIRANSGELLSEILVKNKILSSKSEWRRLILENAIHDLSRKKNITDVNFKISGNLILKIGKRRFIKIKIT